MARYEEPSRWTRKTILQKIDPILLADKRRQISREMQSRSVAAQELAGNPSQWAAAELKITNEWAEKYLIAWKEIWATQGFPECHEFYRAFYDWEIVQLIAARKATFDGKAQKFAMVKRQPHFYSAAQGYFARELDRLKGDWNNRVDVESRNAMYAARREALNAANEPKTDEAKPAKAHQKKAGRKPKIDPKFRRFAGQLWMEHQDSGGKVRNSALKEIGTILDSSPYSRPADHLEGKAAEELKAYNRNNGHSNKKLMTWTAIATSHSRFETTMRRTLSRSAQGLRK